MELEAVLKAYRRTAPYYDAVFGVLLGPGRRRTVRLANRLQGRRLLEVGVGTGLSLARYRRDFSIVGIDVSEEMLSRAQERVAAKGLDNVEGLYNMDAENLDFADDSFDIVCAMYIASVVPHPARLLSELQRVCKPDGHILIVNHFAKPNGIRGFIEHRLAGQATRLGWHPDFALDPFLEPGSAEVVKSWEAPPLRLFTILQCRNGKLDAAATAAEAEPAPRRAAGMGR